MNRRDYPVTAAMGHRAWCPSCQAIKVIYVMVDQLDTEPPERLTCCATCQRILERVVEGAEP